ncbi:MAG: glycosyl transferase family 1 [Fimbriimonadales bacterium]|nr:MAG: glycosyl transferase family 1 [Fimbriimonadales bacterium]
MKRILHIVGDSKYGGGSYIILRLAQMAKQQGWQPAVLTTDTVFQQVLNEHQIPSIPLQCIWREINLLRDWQGYRRLRAYLAREGYDLVHTHTSKGGVIGRAAAWHARIPAVVHTVHGFAFHEQSRPWAIRFYAGLERLAARWCHRIVTVSEYHMRWALQLGIGTPQQLRAIPNGIEPQRAAPQSAPDSLRQQLHIAPDTRVILSTGRLATQKGLEYLIQAARLLQSADLPPFVVLIAGDGPLRQHLERQACAAGVGKQVRFLGFWKAVGDLLAIADIVVLPTLWEGLSIALLEAMAAGKPIITTTIGSNLEATDNGSAAKLVPPKDPISLADAMREWLLHPEHAHPYAEAARRRFQKYYTEEKMLEKYRQLYCELLYETDRSGSAPCH